MLTNHMTLSLFIVLRQKYHDIDQFTSMRADKSKETVQFPVNWNRTIQIGMSWIEVEPTVFHAYESHQDSYGQLWTSTPDPCGFIINSTHWFFGRIPQVVLFKVHWTSYNLKCPYLERNITPAEACTLPGGCCETDPTTQVLRVKESHPSHKFRGRWPWENSLGVIFLYLLVRDVALCHHCMKAEREGKF